MRTRPFDAVAVVEAAYSLENETPTWLERIARALAPGLPPHEALLCGSYEANGSTLRYPAISVVGSTMPLPTVGQGAFATEMAEAMGRVPGPQGRPPSGVDFWARGSWSFAAMRETLGDDHAFVSMALAPFRHLGVVDCVNLMCRTDRDRGVVVGAFSQTRLTATSAQRRRFTRIALHVASAHRLRETLGAAPRLDARTTEAVLAPDGGTVHAAVEATKAPSVRAALRERVRCIDRARSAARQRDGGDEALDLWKGLVLGTWSLIDAYDADGRRYVVAHRNPPGARDPRGLSPRERQVAHLVALGHSNAEVAYALGISESAVGTHVGRLLRKLGCRRRGELIATMQAVRHPSPEELAPDLTSSAASRIDGERPGLASLTVAERAVLSGVVEGLSNASIAGRRSVGVPTIAKQVSSIYRKLGVRDRSELVVWLSGSPPTDGP